MKAIDIWPMELSGLRLEAESLKRMAVSPLPPSADGLQRS